jgi:hypothetical protein
MGFMSAPSGGGDFVTYVKYNAKAGRFYTKPDGGGDEYEVTDFTAIFDMDNLQTGWFLFAAGQAPSKVMDASLTQMSANPGEGYKRGFQLNLYSDKNLSGLREFSSTAGVVIEAMNTLYDQWEANKASNAGKLPVVKCAGVTPITGKHGTSYRPDLQVVAWADRPAQLVAPSAPPAAAPAASAPTYTPAAHTPPPGASDAVEF